MNFFEKNQKVIVIAIAVLLIIIILLFSIFNKQEKEDTSMDTQQPIEEQVQEVPEEVEPVSPDNPPEFVETPITNEWDVDNTGVYNPISNSWTEVRDVNNYMQEVINECLVKAGVSSGYKYKVFECNDFSYSVLVESCTMGFTYDIRNNTCSIMAGSNYLLLYKNYNPTEDDILRIYQVLSQGVDMHRSIIRARVAGEDPSTWFVENINSNNEIISISKE